MPIINTEDAGFYMGTGLVSMIFTFIVDSFNNGTTSLKHDTKFFLWLIADISYCLMYIDDENID